MNDDHVDLSFVCVRITNRCTAKCAYCAYWRIPPRDLPLETFSTLVSYSAKKKISAFNLTGGEPLCHPQIKQFLKILRDNSIVVTLATNGWELGKLTEEDLSGIDTLQVSIDTWEPQNYAMIRGLPMLERITQGIKQVKNLSSDLKIAATFLIQPKNIPYLKGMRRFSEDIGASSLSLLVPFYGNSSFGWDVYGSGPKIDILSQEEINMLQNSIEYLEKLEIGANCFLSSSSEVLAEYVQYFRMWAGLPFHLPKRACIVPHATIAVTERGFLKPCIELLDEFQWDWKESPFSSEEIYRFRSNFKFGMQLEQCKTCMQFIGMGLRPLAEPPIVKNYGKI